MNAERVASAALAALERAGGLVAVEPVACLASGRATVLTVVGPVASTALVLEATIVGRS